MKYLLIAICALALFSCRKEMQKPVEPAAIKPTAFVITGDFGVNDIYYCDERYEVIMAQIYKAWTENLKELK